MTTLVQNWLNNEVGLSRQISNCEKDFQNGTLFVELLYHCKLISEEEYSKFGAAGPENDGLHDEKKEAITVSSAVTNATEKKAEAAWRQEKEAELKTLQRFEFITSILSRENIKYAPDIVGRIRTEQYGAASSIVMSIKAKDNEPLTHQGELSPMAKKALNSRRPRVFKREPTIKSGHCGDVITELMNDVDGVSWNKIDMAVHLKPFRDHRREIEGNMDREEEIEYQAKVERRALRRLEELKAMEEKREFYRQWEAEGKKKWGKNMRTKRANFKRLLEYELYVQKKRQIKEANESYRYKTVCERGTIDFEQNLLRLGIDPGDEEDGGSGEPGDLIEKNIVPSKEGEQSFFQRLIDSGNDIKEEISKECAEFVLEVSEKAKKVRMAAKEKEIRARKEKCDAEKAAEVQQPDPEKLLIDHLRHQSKRINDMQEKQAYRKWMEEEKGRKAKFMAKAARTVMDEAVAKSFEEMNNSGRVEEILQEREAKKEGKSEFIRELEKRKHKKHTNFISEISENYIDFVLQVLMVREHGLQADLRRGEDWEKVLDGSKDIDELNQEQGENKGDKEESKALTQADILSLSEWNSLKARFVSGEDFANKSLENQLAKEEEAKNKKTEEKTKQKLKEKGVGADAAEREEVDDEDEEEDDDEFVKIDEEGTISKLISKQWYKDWRIQQGPFQINSDTVTPIEPLPNPSDASIADEIFSIIQELCSKEGPSIRLFPKEEEETESEKIKTAAAPIKLLYIKQENQRKKEDEESTEEESTDKEKGKEDKDDMDQSIIKLLCSNHNLIPLSLDIAVDKATSLANPSEKDTETATGTNKRPLTEDEEALKELGAKYSSIKNDPKSKDAITDILLVDIIKGYAKCYTDTIGKDPTSEDKSTVNMVSGSGDLESEEQKTQLKENPIGFVFFGEFAASSLRLKLLERAFGSTFMDEEVTQYIAANTKKEKGKKDAGKGGGEEESTSLPETIFDLIFIANVEEKAEKEKVEESAQDDTDDKKPSHIVDLYSTNVFANTFDNDIFVHLSLVSPVSLIQNQESADLAIFCQKERKQEYKRYKETVDKANEAIQQAEEDNENSSTPATTIPEPPAYAVLMKMIEDSRQRFLQNLPKGSQIWREHLLHQNILDLDTIHSTVLVPWKNAEESHRGKCETMLLNIVRRWRELEVERREKRQTLSALLRKSLKSSYCATSGSILTKLEQFIMKGVGEARAIKGEGTYSGVKGKDNKGKGKAATKIIKKKKRQDEEEIDNSYDNDNNNIDWVEEIETHLGDVVESAYDRYGMVSSELSLDLQDKMVQLYRLTRSCVSHCINEEVSNILIVSQGIATFDSTIDSTTKRCNSNSEGSQEQREGIESKDKTDLDQKVNKILYSLVDELDDAENNVKDNDINDNIEEDEIRIALRSFVAKVQIALQNELDALSTEAYKGIVAIIHKGVNNTLSILSMVAAMEDIIYTVFEEDRHWGAEEIKQRTHQQHKALATWINDTLYDYIKTVDTISGQEITNKQNKPIEEIYHLLHDIIQNNNNNDNNSNDSSDKNTEKETNSPVQNGIEEEERIYLLPQHVHSVVSEPGWGYLSLSTIQQLATILRSVSKDAVSSCEGLFMDTELFCYTISSNQKLLQFRYPADSCCEYLKMALDPYHVGKINWGFFIHSCLLSSVRYAPSLPSLLALLEVYNKNISSKNFSSSEEQIEMAEKACSCLPDRKDFKLWSATSVNEREASEDFAVKRKAMEPAEVEKQGYDHFYREILLILLDSLSSSSFSSSSSSVDLDIDLELTLALVMMPWCQQLYPSAGNTSLAATILPSSFTSIVYLYFFLSTTNKQQQSQSNLKTKLSLTSTEARIFTYQLPKGLLELSFVYATYLPNREKVQKLLTSSSTKEKSMLSIEDLYACIEFTQEMKKGLISLPTVSTAIGLGRL